MEYLQEAFTAISSKMGGAFTKVLGALIILLIGLFLARVSRNIVRRMLNRTKMDEQIGQKFNMNFRVDQFITKLVYSLVVVYTLVIVLGMMGLNSVLRPLESMLEEFLSFLPNLVGAGIIGFAGYLISKIASEATGFLSNNLEPYAVKSGFKNPNTLTNILKQIVFILVFLPILIVALDTLNMKAISVPASEMLSTFLNALPNIFAAIIITGAFYIASKFITGLLKELLKNLGVDHFAQEMNISRMIGNRSMATLIGNIAFFFLMFTGIITGAERLGLSSLNDILNNIFQIAGQVFFGVVILTAGAYIANIVGETLSKSDSKWMSPIAKFSVIGIFLAFALHTMGIAESIVNLAFGLTLGAAATAFALAFGLGGREVAGKQLERFFENAEKNGSSSTVKKQTYN
jgi:hypothetical protein